MERGVMGEDLQLARSILFVPGDRPERFAKACASPADAVIFDLEDAVLAPNKAQARAAIARYLDEHSGQSVLVRINATGTAEHHDDMTLCRHVGVSAVVLPKAETADSVTAVGASTGKPVWCIIESARGLAALSQLAACPSTARLILGTIDLALDLGIKIGTDAASAIFDTARFNLIVASLTSGRARPVDGVHTNIKDTEGLSRMAAHARDSGFGGMLCIHPSQCLTVNKAFLPTATETTWAQKVIAAAASNPGAFQLDGQMIDAPVIARARRLLNE